MIEKFVLALRSIPLTLWLALLGLGIFGWFSFFGKHGLYEMEQLRRIKAELSEQKIKLEKEKQNLEAELQHLHDREYLKHLIHKELGYVEEREVVIKFAPKNSN